MRNTYVQVIGQWLWNLITHIAMFEGQLCDIGANAVEELANRLDSLHRHTVRMNGWY